MASIKRGPGWFTEKNWQSLVKPLKFNAVLFFPKLKTLYWNLLPEKKNEGEKTD